MQLIVHIPDEMIEKVKDKLPPPQMGLLESVALDALLGFLTRVERSFESPFSLIREK
jgi:hypothetical protein